MKMTYVLMAFFVTSLSLAQEPSSSKALAESSAQEAAKLISSKCGCDVSINFDWSGYPDEYSMNKTPQAVQYFGQAMSSFCADDGKEEACKIKVLKFSYKPKAMAKFSEGNADIAVDGRSFGTFEGIEEEIKNEKNSSLGSSY